MSDKAQVNIGRTTPPLRPSVPRGLLQRKCACGDACGISGSCEDCTRRKLTMQRSASGQAEPQGVGPIVRDVLNSPGQPLDSSTNAFMESRFGHDFSRVRVHTDEQAARSARAVRAQAYTVGQDIVFGAGQYAAHSVAGKHLLAHELTHTIQQGGSSGLFASRLSIGRADDPYEREADAAADAVMSSPAVVPLAAKDPAPPALRRQVIDDEELMEEPEGFVCGPNVTVPVAVAVSNIQTSFGGWNLLSKVLACSNLLDPIIGTFAWDINELHMQDWILGYRPDCATRGATPACDASVQISKGCHYAGSVNYVIFGTMCKLCHDFLFNILDPRWLDFTEPAMLTLISLYKGDLAPFQAEPSANFEASKSWARVGYRGWPSANSPPGDRPNCKPICREPYDGPRFTVNWFPFYT
jgi:hypothetical protein